MELNTIYKSSDGEYFKCVDREGTLCLSNPSYPFVFLPEVLEPLEEIGDAEKYGHLIEKVDSQFFEGETLNVEVSDDGTLRVLTDTTPTTPKECNCVMSGYAQTSNYCPVHRGEIINER